MVEVKMSLWRRSLLLRLVCYSMFAAFLVAVLMLAAFWQNHHPLRRGEYQEVAEMACAAFWVTFLFGGAMLWFLKKGHEAYENR